MTPTSELLRSVIQLRLDVACVVGFGALASWICWRFLRVREATKELSCGWWFAAAAIILGGVVGAEWNSSRRQDALAETLSAFAPTYARELQRLGHDQLTGNVSSSNPKAAAIAAAVRDWFTLNRSLGELFTYRVTPDGRIVPVIDAGKPPLNGRLENPGVFRRALAGETLFDTEPIDNARGSWVRVYAPVRTATGQIDAGLVLGYPAAAWWQWLTEARIIVLAPTTALMGGFLALTAFVGVTRRRSRAQHETERQLHEAKIAADEASRAKSDFLAVMSHEIRTPLNAVMGFANLLAESRLDDAQRGYLATITSEGARLSSLVNDLLDLSKIEEGRLVLERLPFAPAEVAHEVLRLLQPRAQEKKIDLHFEAQLAGPLLVAGDPLRFRQILVNLVDNAIKFTPQGTVTLFLQWQPGPAGTAAGELSVRVRDTGIGIPPEKIGDLFQKFMQADTSMTRRYGGTGLGLAICQRLVALMGGQIRVESKLGHGSDFIFNLPLVPVALPPETGLGEVEAYPLPACPPRVLVVDDMETNRFLLEVFLRRNGFEPALASGGEEAVRMATRERFDAILMDLQMPDIDGYTATQRIRAAEPAGQHTVIIALTATIARGTREKCLAAGMDEHLTKPLDLRKFKHLLHKLIVRGPATESAGAR
jgi:signal transduction histidine kinase/ActR/RegA family two-component response regulator